MTRRWRRGVDGGSPAARRTARLCRRGLRSILWWSRPRLYRRPLTRRFPSAVSPTRPSPRRRRFGTSASSLTSTTASPHLPTGCCSSPGSSTNGRCARSTSTGWTSNASGASRSRRRTCACRGRPTGSSTCCISSTRLDTSTSPTRCRAHWRRAKERCCWSTQPRASRRRRWPTSTSLWIAIWPSSRCSTRSTCPPPTRTATPPSWPTSSVANPRMCCGCPARPVRGSPSCSTRWCVRFRRPPETPMPRRGR